MLLLSRWLAGVSRKVCQTMGTALLAAERVGAALPWLWRADDSSALQQLAAHLQAEAASPEILAQSEPAAGARCLTCMSYG